MCASSRSRKTGVRPRGEARDALERARITPACPVSDKCGGCCYQHITYEEELRAKEKKVRDALTRIGKQDGEKLLGITGAETTEHYRNKAQYPVGRDREGNIVTGFLPSAQP